MWDGGFQDYVHDWWNLMDFVMNSLYLATISLKIVAYTKVTNNLWTAERCCRIEWPFSVFSFYLSTITCPLQYSGSKPRNQWEMWHPTLVAEAVFAIANIFSSLRLISLFTANSHLGPLQISLGRMLLDILKFLFIYCLVRGCSHLLLTCVLNDKIVVGQLQVRTFQTQTPLQIVWF